jgi:hypothetical protein
MTHPITKHTHTHTRPPKKPTHTRPKKSNTHTHTHTHTRTRVRPHLDAEAVHEALELLVQVGRVKRVKQHVAPALACAAGAQRACVRRDACVAGCVAASAIVTVW